MRKRKIGSDGQLTAGGRWVIGGTLVGMVLLTLGFWWQGDLSERVQSELEEWREPAEVAPSPTIIPIQAVATNDLQQAIEVVLESAVGRYVVLARGLGTTRWEVEVGETDAPIGAASLIKLPVMAAVYQMAERGDVDLEANYTLKAGDFVGGSGSLVGKPVGYEAGWRELVWHMGNESDNTAFRAVVNSLGEERLQQEFVGMGLESVSIATNQITPREAGELVEEMYRNEEAYGEVLDSMVRTWYEDRIPAGVPVGVRVAHKVGTEVGVVSDVGIVYAEEPYLLVVMTEGVRQGEAQLLLPEISRVVWKWVEENLN